MSGGGRGRQQDLERWGLVMGFDCLGEDRDAGGMIGTDGGIGELSFQVGRVLGRFRRNARGFDFPPYFEEGG